MENSIKPRLDQRRLNQSPRMQLGAVANVREHRDEPITGQKRHNITYYILHNT